MSCYLPVFEMKSCITCLCAQILVNALDVNVYDTVVNDLSKTSNCRVFINLLVKYFKFVANLAFSAL